MVCSVGVLWCGQAWVGHPYYDVIDNSTDFEHKVVRMIAVSVHSPSIALFHDLHWFLGPHFIVIGLQIYC